MNTATSSLDPFPAPRLREACSNLVGHLKSLGYTNADHTTCERLLRAFFPYQPILTEGSPDVAAGTAFLERFVSECRKRISEANGAPRARRCYGQVVEQAIIEAESHGAVTAVAPRLTELMTQLDADGHNTTQLRIELESLVDALGVKQFYR